MKKHEVYFNLHKQCLSERPVGGRVRHVTEARYATVAFVVQPAGREKVRREGKKNVHAFVRGYRVNDMPLTPTDDAFKVIYNPYKYDSFMKVDPATGDLTPIYGASYAWVIGKTIYAI